MIRYEFRIPRYRRYRHFFCNANYHSVLLPVAIVDAPDILRPGCGGLLADLVGAAYRVGKQVARCRATASGFREHDAAPGSKGPLVDQRRPPFIICQAKIHVERVKSTHYR